jgi:HAD superfamily hydrolase (TIGR01509 family)
MSLLIFDLDGTLVDCKQLHQQAFRWAVQQQDPTAQFDDHDVEGLPTTGKIKHLQSRGIHVNMAVDSLKRDYTRAHITDFIQYDPELHELMDRAERDHRLAVCSNSRNEFLLKCLSILDLWRFELVFSRDHGPAKPNPWMFTECMRITQTDPANTWIFEDSPVGLEAAHLSGANVVPVQDSADLKRKLREL